MENTPLQPIGTTPSDRARRMKQAPAVIWLTGLSGAGKSTIADRLDQRLHHAGYGTFVLDGDNLRRGLNSDLGFSDADRTENVRRVGHIAALMADAGLIVIVSLISPYRHDREKARETIGEARFVEVFVDAPLEICAARDPKGMYAKARAGLIRSFTGIASDYEPPERPDIHLRTDRSDPDTSVAVLIEALEERGTVSPEPGTPILDP